MIINLELVGLRELGFQAVDRAFIDSGYRPGDKLRRPDHQVYKFTRRFPGLAFPTKGTDSIENMAVIDAAYLAAGLPARGTVVE